MIAAWLQRKNGLVLSSSSIVLGKLGSCCALSLSTRCFLSNKSMFSGSKVSANAMFLVVYSCVQNTFVFGASVFKRCNEFSICAGVPSNNRPQPAPNKVSPQNKYSSFT